MSFSGTQILALALDPSSALRISSSLTGILNGVFDTGTNSLRVKIQGYSLDNVVDPAVTDDSTAGFPVGSIWINIAADTAFISVDSTDGAAVWKDITGDSWEQVGKSKYTATPASDSTITMSDTSDFFVGAGLEYTDGSGIFRALVTAIDPDTTITIAGPPLDIGDDIALLRVGANQAVSASYFVPGKYGKNLEDNLLAVESKSPSQWSLGKAFLVAYKSNQDTTDTGVEAKINIELNNLAVSTNDTNKGVQLGAAGAWIENPAVAISSVNYAVERGQEVEIACKEAGGTGTADDLTVDAVYILER